MAFSPNEDDLPDTPEERAEVNERTPSERLRAVLYVWFKQETEEGKFTGTFDTFKAQKYDSIIEGVKKKLK